MNAKFLILTIFGFLSGSVFAQQPLQLQQAIDQMKENNTAIILVSEELEEIAKLADRVGVIFSGKILGEFPVKEMDTEKIGALMAGIVGNGGAKA